jgi:hypothetical protein
MAFGNFKIRAEFGGERITDRNAATSFLLSLSKINRNKPHWRAAATALRDAHKSGAAESRASTAFEDALEAERWIEH